MSYKVEGGKSNSTIKSSSLQLNYKNMTKEFNNKYPTSLISSTNFQFISLHLNVHLLILLLLLLLIEQNSQLSIMSLVPSSLLS